MITKLLDKDKSTRLGAGNDWHDIMEHPFFASIDIDALMKFEIEPTYVPE